MFSSSGKVVKALAILFFIAGIIGSVIAAIMLFGIETYSFYRESTHPYVWAGILTLIGGPIVSWLNANIFYALGEAAESARHNTYYITSLESEINKLRQTLENEKKSTDKPQNESAPTDPQTIIPEKIDVSRPASPVMWRCLTCGTENSDSDGICKKCGTFKSAFSSQN